MKVDTVEKLFMNELKDLYSAEKQITRALPKMAKAATSEELRTAFQTHLEETKGHIERLDRVFEILDKPASAKTCKGMKGLIEEGSEMMEEAEGEVCDAGLIAAAQRVEHYEIAAYGTMRAMAEMMGQQEIAQLLQETLDEEGKTDKLLTKIAMRVNKMALRQSTQNQREAA
jgi:ferritin-like metal-binding protein YciE